MNDSISLGGSDDPSKTEAPTESPAESPFLKALAASEGPARDVSSEQPEIIPNAQSAPEGQTRSAAQLIALFEKEDQSGNLFRDVDDRLQGLIYRVQGQGIRDSLELPKFDDELRTKVYSRGQKLAQEQGVQIEVNYFWHYTADSPQGKIVLQSILEIERERAKARLDELKRDSGQADLLAKKIADDSELPVQRIGRRIAVLAGLLPELQSGTDWDNVDPQILQNFGDRFPEYHHDEDSWGAPFDTVDDFAQLSTSDKERVLRAMFEHERNRLLILAKGLIEMGGSGGIFLGDVRSRDAVTNEPGDKGERIFDQSERYPLPAKVVLRVLSCGRIKITDLEENDQVKLAALVSKDGDPEAGDLSKEYATNPESFWPWPMKS